MRVRKEKKDLRNFIIEKQNQNGGKKTTYKAIDKGQYKVQVVKENSNELEIGKLLNSTNIKSILPYWKSRKLNRTKP